MKSVKLWFLLPLCGAILLALFLWFFPSAPKEVRLPILMYHHLAEQGDDSATISIEQFRHQMALLKEEGYQPVSLRQVIGYGEKGVALPQKAVLITFDDGYLSNYQYAYPILKEHQFPAAIFAIGSSFGRQEYKETDHLILPHFGKRETEEMTQSGWIEVQSHTFDLHQYAPYEEQQPARESILPLEGESAQSYQAMLTEDHQQMQALLADCGIPSIDAVAYPHGKWSPAAEELLVKLGCKITLTTDSAAPNLLRRGDPRSLLHLGRMNICGNTTDEQLLEYLSRS